ncbi:MAG: hypothetical protein ABSA49_08875 [Rhizomicrobium sp.]
MNDAELFKKFLPELTAITDVQTMEFFKRNGEIVSANGRQIAIDSFLLVMSTGADTVGPFPLNGVTARALCRYLIDAGFGPPELQHQ